MFDFQIVDLTVILSIAGLTVIIWGAEIVRHWRIWREYALHPLQKHCKIVCQGVFFLCCLISVNAWLIKRCWVQSINHERCDTMEFWEDSNDKLATQFHVLSYILINNQDIFILRRFWLRFGYTVLILGNLRTTTKFHDDDVYILRKDWSGDVSFGGKKET